ncbi:MAG: AEC family transporter [Ruminococcaceae bacterium]|nr:AEC family transporter [Oscillospiraceae bacterium]
MLAIFNAAFNAVVPIILIVLLGYFLRRKQFLSDNFLSVGNKLVFRVLLPVMLFINVYNIPSFSSIPWDIVVYCIVTTLLLFALGLVAAITGTPVPQRRGVIAQCCFRSNFALIGLPLAAAVGNDEAIALASVLSAFTIPLYNILAVVCLTMFLPNGNKKSAGIGHILSSVVRNPLILGVAAGLVALLVRELQRQICGEVVFSISEDIPFLHSFLNSLKGAATPLGLLVMGGQFDFSATKTLKKEITIGVLARLVFAPLIGVGLGILLSSFTDLIHLGQNDYPALVALCGTPTAVSSAIMAGEMDNDQQLAVQLVIWTSIGSVVTVFAIICALMGMGLLAI